MQKIRMLAGTFELGLVIAIAFVILLIVGMFTVTSLDRQTTPADVQTVLSRIGMKPFQEYSVLYSYESFPDLFGEQDIYFCLQLTDTRLNEFGYTEWRKGAIQSPLVREAFDITRSMGQADKCFLSQGVPPLEGRSRMLLSLYTFSGSTLGAEALFFEPASDRLLYVRYDT